MNINDILDERAIHRQLCALAAAMDARDWSALSSVVTEDATGDFGDGNLIQGRAGFESMFRRFLGNCGPTQHLFGNLIVEVDGDQANSRCYVRDMHQGRDERSDKFLSTPGEYQDRWVRTTEGWRLVHRTKINLMMIGSLEALGDF